MKKYYKIVFSIFIFLFFTFRVEAAILYFEPKTQELGLGQEFQVDLMLDTQGKEINAMEVSIIIPEELIEVVNIRDGSSILTLWVERPKIETRIDANTNTKYHEIKFVGIVPGGFSGIVGPYEGARPGKVCV